MCYDAKLVFHGKASKDIIQLKDWTD